MSHEAPLILGIDPGLSGALVIYNPFYNSVTNAIVMPTVTKKNKGKSKKILDIPRLVKVVSDLHKENPGLTAFVELVGANRIRGRVQGVTSMFSFGVMAGALETSLLAAGIPFKKIPPSVWKPALGCSQDKNQTLERASVLIPAGKEFWTPKRLIRTKTDCSGIAEAALIAYYGSVNSLGPSAEQSSDFRKAA